MKRAGRWALGGAASALLVTGLTSGCSSGGETCDCADPQVTITVTADVASSVTVASIQLSGSACTNVALTCTNQTSGCTAYSFTPNGAGTCDIKVDNDGTTFEDTLTVLEQTGCCAGFFVSPASAAQVSVPEPGDGG